MPSYFCIFLSRPRTRRQHFPQDSQLQKKLMPMRRMSFKLLKRCVTHIGPLRLPFLSSGEDCPFIASFAKWPAASHPQLLLAGLSFPFSLLFSPSHHHPPHEAHDERASKQPLDCTAKVLCRDITEALELGSTHCYLSPFLFQQRIQSLMTKMTAMVNEEVRGTVLGCVCVEVGMWNLPELLSGGQPPEGPPSSEPSLFSTQYFLFPWGFSLRTLFY